MANLPTTGGNMTGNVNHTITDITVVSGDWAHVDLQSSHVQRVVLDRADIKITFDVRSAATSRASYGILLVQQPAGDNNYEYSFQQRTDSGELYTPELLYVGFRNNPFSSPPNTKSNTVNAYVFYPTMGGDKIIISPMSYGIPTAKNWTIYSRESQRVGRWKLDESSSSTTAGTINCIPSSYSSGAKDNSSATGLKFQRAKINELSIAAIQLEPDTPTQTVALGDWTAQNGDLSVEIWLQASSLTEDYTNVVEIKGSAKDVEIALVSGNIQVRFNGVANFVDYTHDYTNPTQITITSGFTGSDYNVECYIDGVSRGTTTCTTSENFLGKSTNALLRCDTSVTASEFVQFSDFVHYGKELSSTEITNLFNTSM